MQDIASEEDGGGETVSPSRLRILLAEDHPINRKLLTAILAVAGHETDVAENGKQAVERAMAGAYDLVLLDLRMPVMDGFAAAAGIRALEPPDRRVPILAVTANASDNDLARCRAAGIDAVLSKPISAEKLLTAVAHFAARTPAP